MTLSMCLMHFSKLERCCVLCDAGFFPPTSGTAVVNGFDIRRDIDRVRTSLGLCPQHNILFDDLTVQEHLIFFTKVHLKLSLS